MAVLVLALTGHAADDPARKSAELEQLRQKIEKLQHELQASQKKKSRADRKLREAEEAVNDSRRALQKTEQALTEAKADLGRLDARRRESQAQLTQQARELGREVRAAYAMGRQQQIKLLLNQENPSAIGRQWVYFSYLSRARQAKITTTRQLLQDLDSLTAEIERKNQSLFELHTRQRTQTEDLEAQQQQRRQLVAALQQRLSRQGKTLERLKLDEQQLQKLVESLKTLLSDIPSETGQQKPFKALKGELRWPARGRLASHFGGLRGNSGLKWQGVLIEAPEGEQVRAVSQGRVAFADWMRGFGLLLIIDHGDGYMTLYGHNQALYKEVGEWVDSGEVVATLGASGGQTKAGLYFEIRHNGQPVNPQRWCAGKPAGASG